MKEGQYEFPNIRNELGDQPDYLKDTLRISNLVKSFPSTDRKSLNTAIDNLSLSVFKNQIFVLLGHNGAGKTTTIQTLTGFINKTSGNA